MAGSNFSRPLHPGLSRCNTPAQTLLARPPGQVRLTRTHRRHVSMPFIITDPCIETKDTACVDVCPVDCIHPRKDEPEFAQTTMLYIHPEECIDCGACVP